MLAEICRLTVSGKFPRIGPSIERIRLDFQGTIPLKGSVQIGVYYLYHVYIDFALEEDYRSVFSRNFLPIPGIQMKMLKWTTVFKLDVEITLAPTLTPKT